VLELYITHATNGIKFIKLDASASDLLSKVSRRGARQGRARMDSCRPSPSVIKGKGEPRTERSGVAVDANARHAVARYLDAF
jgi:hypothetical protein